MADSERAILLVAVPAEVEGHLRYHLSGRAVTTAETLAEVPGGADAVIVWVADADAGSRRPSGARSRPRPPRQSRSATVAPSQPATAIGTSCLMKPSATCWRPCCPTARPPAGDSSPASADRPAPDQRRHPEPRRRGQRCSGLRSWCAWARARG